MVRRLLAACLLLPALAACAGEGGPVAASSPTPATTAMPSPTSTPEPTAEPTSGATSEPTEDPAPAPADEAPAGTGSDVAGTPGTGEVVGGDFPSMAGDTAYLTDVRVGAHDGFDRVVLEFDGGGPPSHRVGYIPGPVTEAGSGATVPVEGEAYLSLRMTPASGVDLEGIDLTPTYTGPDRVRGAGTEVVTEVVRTGDFEATLEWVVGVAHEAPFTAVWLSDPLRLVVDVAAR